MFMLWLSPYTGGAHVVNTRPNLLPDPGRDAVVALVYCLQDSRLATHTVAPALHAGYHPGCALRPSRNLFVV